MAGLGVAVPPASASPVPPDTPSLTGGAPLGNGDPVGQLQTVRYPGGQVRFVGWASDPDDPTANVTVRVLEDGRLYRAVTASPTDIARPGIARKQGTGPTPGFNLPVPIPAGGVHTLCVAAANLTGRGAATVLGCALTPAGSTLTTAATQAHSPVGALESVTATGTSTPQPTSTVTITGWASDPDYRVRHTTVVAYLDGASAATFTTRFNRPDVAAANPGVYRRSGYSTRITAGPGAHNVCVWAVNVGFGANTLLGCATIDTRAVPSSAAAPSSGTAVSEPAVNAQIVNEVRKHLGQRYVWAAAGPTTFDCSGLVQYAYAKFGISVPRIADDQFHAARVIPADRAVPGDLVFYRDGVGEVYHVGVYLSPELTIAAIDPAHGVAEQRIWDDQIVSYGSFTHD